jgi:hypothetical protein
MDGYSGGEFLVMGFLSCVGGLFLGLIIAMVVGGDVKRDFAADRACRPGMLVERLDDSRALCIGGQRETWIVRVQ